VIGMRTLIAIAAVIGILLSAFSAAAQSIGGPHKTINRIGGAKPTANPVVAAPRNAASPPQPAAPANRSAGTGLKPSVK
jgi:hypothetical protein